MNYVLHVLILIAIYASVTLALDLVAGHAGLVSLSHAAFFGIGAYAAALCSVHLRLTFPLSFAVALIVGCMSSLVISLPSLRIRDDYFVIATFGFQVISVSLFNNWTAVTRGPLGIPGIPAPTILGWEVGSRPAFLIGSTLFAALAFVVVRNITASPFGRVLHAIREDDILAQSLGKDTIRAKVIVFAISACLAAGSGCIYAYYATYVDPLSFTVVDSILILAMIVVGGAGSLWGPVLGACLLTALPEILRFAGVPSSMALNIRQVVYGLLLVAMMIWRPRGLVGAYGFAR